MTYYAVPEYWLEGYAVGDAKVGAMVVSAAGLGLIAARLKWENEAEPTDSWGNVIEPTSVWANLTLGSSSWTDQLMPHEKNDEGLG